jgi:hypothetical protein
MKVLYIGSTASIIYTIRFQEPIKSTYDKAQDTFLHWKYAVAPCAVVAILTSLLGAGLKKFDFMELLWTFSIYLEAIAILPQLIVLQRYRECENLTGNLFHGILPGFVYCQLDLPGSYGTALQTPLGSLLLRCLADTLVCGFLLLLHQEQIQGRKILFANYG